MRQAGELKLTHDQTAVMLGVSRATLELFWDQYPDFREEFDRGKQIRLIKLKAVGDRHAVLDAATWRFLAKNELGLSDDPSKTVLQTEAAKAIASGPDETRSKIMEITGKLINGSVAREAPAGNVGTVPGNRAGGGGQARQAGQLDAALDKMEKVASRLRDLEASAVRKNPRKDGQPHTDRSKVNAQDPQAHPAGAGLAPGARSSVPPVASVTNKPMAHAPPRLPGRLGSK